jgi:hypothetical protein
MERAGSIYNLLTLAGDKYEAKRLPHCVHSRFARFSKLWGWRIWIFAITVERQHHRECEPFWSFANSRRYPGVVECYLTRLRGLQWFGTNNDSKSANGHDLLACVTDYNVLRISNSYPDGESTSNKWKLYAEYSGQQWQFKLLRYHITLQSLAQLYQATAAAFCDWMIDRKRRSWI